jgi:hypothetical protein
MRVGIAALVLGCLLWVSPSQADWIRVEAGNHGLAPDLAGQFVDVMIFGEGTVNNAYVQALIESPVPAENGMTGKVPTITYIDFVEPGSLFEVNNDGVDRFLSYGQYGYAGWAENAAATLAPPPNYVPTTVALNPNGQLLARFTIDTTGFLAGSFGFNLGPFEVVEGFIGTTSFLDFNGSVAIDNGSLNIVPEPSSLLLMLAGLTGLGVIVWRRKRA